MTTSASVSSTPTGSTSTPIGSSSTQTGNSTEQNLLQDTPTGSSSTLTGSSTERNLLLDSSTLSPTPTVLHPTQKSTLLGDFYHPNIEDAIAIKLSQEDLDFLTHIPSKKLKQNQPEPLESLDLAPTKKSGFICSEANPLDFLGVTTTNKTPTTQPLRVTFTPTSRTVRGRGRGRPLTQTGLHKPGVSSATQTEVSSTLPKKDSIIQTAASVEVQTNRMVYHKNMVSFTNDKIPGPVKLPQDFTLNLELIVREAVKMAGRKEYLQLATRFASLMGQGFSAIDSLHGSQHVSQIAMTQRRNWRFFINPIRTTLKFLVFNLEQPEYLTRSTHELLVSLIQRLLIINDDRFH